MKQGADELFILLDAFRCCRHTFEGCRDTAGRRNVRLWQATDGLHVFRVFNDIANGICLPAREGKELRLAERATECLDDGSILLVCFLSDIVCKKDFLFLICVEAGIDVALFFERLYYLDSIQVIEALHFLCVVRNIAVNRDEANLVAPDSRQELILRHHESLLLSELAWHIEHLAELDNLDIFLPLRLISKRAVVLPLAEEIRHVLEVVRLFVVFDITVENLEVIMPVIFLVQCFHCV